MNNLVSILLPVYNGERFLKQSIESVLNQTYTNFKLLIYNDGSNDNTLEIIKSFKDERIQVFNAKENKGIVHALNFLINHSNGEYVARIDADDIWYPQKLTKQISFLEQYTELGMLASFARLINAENKILRNVFSNITTQEEIKKKLPKHNFIIHSSVVLRKKKIKKVGLYRDKYLHAEDYDLWLRFIKQNILFDIYPEVLLDYRVYSESVNFRYIKLQNMNAIKLKLNYYKTQGFKFHYIHGLIWNFYYLIYPYIFIKVIKNYGKSIFNIIRNLK